VKKRLCPLMHHVDSQCAIVNIAIRLGKNLSKDAVYAQVLCFDSRVVQTICQQLGDS